MTEPDPIKQRSLYDRLRDFVAKNREDNLQYPTGWHERLQNIYVSHHKLKNTGAGKLQTPHNYSDKK